MNHSNIWVMKKEAGAFNPCERMWKQTSTATGALHLSTYKQF